MLAKKFRLPIQLFNKIGIGQKIKAVRNEYFTAKFKPNDLGFSRFGTVISRKVSKSAVKRNKIKRIIFNFIRLNKLHLKPNKDILVIGLPKIAQLTKSEIEKNLKLLVIGY